MKTIFSILLCLLIYPPVGARQHDETRDSLFTAELNEVVVEAQMQKTTSKVSVYIPGARQKKAAGDATSLLNLMSIPQLSINPITDVVTTVAGQPVAIFIDCTEASPEDIIGLKPCDVKRVEYYDSPSDPKFLGRKHVVNFTMQKYEWGGYTKIDAAQSFGVANTRASVYSKMKYKSVSYDIYAGEQYKTIRNAGDETIEYFRFNGQSDNGLATIGRSNSSIAENSYKNTDDISFRAIYDSDRMRLNNRVSFSYALSPQSGTTNNLRYMHDNDWSENVKTHSVSSGNSLIAIYEGQYLVVLPKSLTINIGTRCEYGNNKINSLYSGTEDLEISNVAYEKSYVGTLNPNLSWQINDSHAVSAYIIGTWQNNKINYKGNSSSRQSYKINGYQAGASYDYETERWSARLDFGWAWQTNTINDYKKRTIYPCINAEASYSPTRNIQLLASYEYYETYPTASSTSPVIIRQDELVSYAGNPNLKNSPSHEAALQCVWLPSNKWQLALTGFHYNIANRRVFNYLPEGPDGTMLRYYTNNGNYMCTMTGLNASAKFFGGKLTARVNPQFWSRKTTGVFAMRRNELTYTLQLTYFWRNFYLSGWYVSPSHYPEENSGIERKTVSQYKLQLGWGNGSWNLGISASDFLRTDRRANREILRSEYYDMSRRVYSPSRYMKFSVTATYTFGYGKKVQRGDEVGGGVPRQSAILK